jgi:hypothetical protein
MSAWLFYVFAVVAFAVAGFFVVQAANGSTNTAHVVGSGVFVFLAILSIAVGNALRVVDRRLRELERARS